MISTDKIIKHGKFKGYKVIYFDIMLHGKFVCQIAYKYCPIFRLDINDLMREVYERRPSLKGKPIEVCETEMIVR